MSIKQRKAFNFYRSYYEIAKELPKKYVGEFLMAVIEYQLEEKEPNLSGLANFAFISQRHSLEKQLNGYKSGVKASTPPEPPPKGMVEGSLEGYLPPTPQATSNQVQVQVQEQVQEQDKGETKSDIEKKFMFWFNKRRADTLGKSSNLKNLTKTDKSNLHKLRKNYNGNDFNTAYNALEKNDWALKNKAIHPTHFLVNNNFNRYFAIGQELGSESDIKNLTPEERLKRINKSQNS